MIQKATRLPFPILVTAIVLSLASASLFASPRVRAGQWEVTSTVNGKANVFKNCMGAEEAAAVNGDAKSGREYTEKLMAGQCKFTDYKVDGNVVTSSMTCGGSTIRTLTTYRGDTFSSDSKTKAGSAPEVSSHIDAKRLGDCP